MLNNIHFKEKLKENNETKNFTSNITDRKRKDT